MTSTLIPVVLPVVPSTSTRYQVPGTTQQHACFGRVFWLVPSCWHIFFLIAKLPDLKRLKIFPRKYYYQVPVVLFTKSHDMRFAKTRPNIAKARSVKVHEEKKGNCKGFWQIRAASRFVVDSRAAAALLSSISLYLTVVLSLNSRYNVMPVGGSKRK